AQMLPYPRDWLVQILKLTQQFVSAYNTFVIWTEIFPDWNVSKLYKRRIFLEEAGKVLVTPHVNRASTCQGPSRCSHGEGNIGEDCTKYYTSA
ncbi:hypothetical protein GOODEAATRI_030171, partial [Goodea atripinnis]